MSFSGLILTNVGRNELAKAEAGEKFCITDIVFGNGNYDGTITNIKEVVSQVMTLPIKKIEHDENKVTVECDFNSADVPEAFYWREIGIIANGKLCYYDNSREDAEYIDPDSETLIKQKRMRFVLLISSEIEVNVTVGSSLYVLKEELIDINDEAPTYTEATTLTALVSGEKLSVSFGKIATAIKAIISHIATKATTSVLGHVKVTDSSAVTDTTGLALAGTEKNAAIGGTLANQISQVKSDIISHIATKATTSVLGHVKFGTVSGTACQGNDSRLSDSRTPKSHASTGTEYGVATTSNYGHVKLSNSSAVTEYAGLALPATEKNAGIGGTLANQIAGKMDKSETLIITKSLSYGYTAPSKERLQLGVTSAASICPSGYTLIAKTVETVGSSNVQASFGTNEILTLYNYASTSISGTVYVRYTYAKTINITT